MFRVTLGFENLASLLGELWSKKHHLIIHDAAPSSDGVENFLLFLCLLQLLSRTTTRAFFEIDSILQSKFFYYFFFFFSKFFNSIINFIIDA